MNPIQAVLRQVDRYRRRHALVGVAFAVVRKSGDDQGGNLSILLAWNAFFALLPLLLVLVTLLGYLLGRQPALQQRVLHSVLAEFPTLGTQLEHNVHSLRANGFGLVVGMAGSLWGARGIAQAGQYAMAEIWNIPAKERPGASAGVNVGMFLAGFRVLAPPGDPGPPATWSATTCGMRPWCTASSPWCSGCCHGHRRPRITTPPSGWPVAQDGRPQGAPTDATRADTRPPGRDPGR